MRVSFRLGVPYIVLPIPPRCWAERSFVPHMVPRRMFPRQDGRTYVCSGRGLCARMCPINAAARAVVGQRLRTQCLLGGILLGGMMAERATTEKPQRILEVIREFSSEHGYPPSVREIGERVGLSSSSTVMSPLKTLERRGLLRRDPTKPRALVANRAEGEPERVASATLPLLGRVAAGVPITASENLEEQFILPASWVPRTGGFMLRVKGDSMIDAAILDGDLIVVEARPNANNGEIVVAMIDGEATVKRFYRESGRVRLQPENATMAPIYADDVTIVGVDWRHGGVLRLQPHAPALAVEALDRRLTVDHRDHDLTVVRVRTGLDDDQIAVQDRRVDHRVALDPQHEPAGARAPRCRQDELLFEVLARGDRHAGRDAAEQRQRRGRDPLRLALGPVGDQRPRLGGIAPQQAAALERLQMRLHRRG